jgi:hypothetical protein
MLRVTRSTTLIFITWSTSIQKSRAFPFQRQHQWNVWARAPRTAGPGIRAHASRGCARPKARAAQADPRPNAPCPEVRRVRAGAPPYARTRHGPAVRRRRRRRMRDARAAVARRASPPSSPVTHGRAELLIKAACSPSARHRVLPRHCRCRTVLEPTARARRRPTALVAPLDTRKPPQLACCPTFHLLTALSRAAAATAAGRRWTPSPATPPPQLRHPTAPRWAPGRAWPLARPAASPVRRRWPRPRRPPLPGTTLLRFKSV